MTVSAAAAGSGGDVGGHLEPPPPPAHGAPSILARSLRRPWRPDLAGTQRAGGLIHFLPPPTRMAPPTRSAALSSLLAFVIHTATGWLGVTEASLLPHFMPSPIRQICRFSLSKMLVFIRQKYYFIVA